MCGIFGIIGKKPRMAQTILDGLKLLEYRGYDSWGIAVAASNSKLETRNSKLLIEKHVGKIGNSTLPSSLLTLDSTLGLGHTRWATHGGVTVKNAHPHLDCQGEIALVHNGIVENFETLKKNLKRKHHFRSQTDTEIIVHLIEELAKSAPFDEAVRRAFLKLQGLNAVVAISPKDQKIVAVKNGSPLIIGKGNMANYIASDQIAILDISKSLAFLPDNVEVVLSQDNIKFFDVKTGKTKMVTFEKPKIKKVDSTKNGFKNFMEKEIFEQSSVVKRIAQNTDGKIKKAAALIKKAQNIYLVGSGTASYAALTMEYLLSDLCQINSQAVAASEFANVQNFLKYGDLIIAYSQSGETADLISAIKGAKTRGATILAIVNVQGSTIDRMADFSLHLAAGPEIAVVTTKAFVAKIAVSLQIAYQLKNRSAEGKRLLLAVAKSLEKQLQDSKIQKLADKLRNAPDLYTIGRNLDYPLALEAALKLKETAYIHAEGFAAGELKHGVIALIEKGTPAIVFATQQKYLAETISSATELAARGAYIIGIAAKPNKIFNYYLPVDGQDPGQIICAVVYAQYLAYLIAVKRGLDPDRPRNLAKSVTVK